MTAGHRTVTALVFDSSTYYTDTLPPDVIKAIADGKPVCCWWFSAEGTRYEETFWFFKEPSWIRTEIIMNNGGIA